MQLDFLKLEPGATSSLQERRFFDFGEAQDLHIERASGDFTAGRNGYLNVMKSLQRIPRRTVTTLPINSTPPLKTIGS